MDNDCENIRNQMADYILGILDRGQIGTFDRHIGECKQCSEHLQSLEKEKSLLLQLGQNIDADMDVRCERAIKALSLQTPKDYRKTNSIWSIIMQNRITKLAAAAVIAIALLIPLSYGMSNIIKKLIAGSVEVDGYQGDFALGKDIRVELEVGTKEQQNIISARNIRFFVEDDELKGTLRSSVNCLPKYKWMTTIELFDLQDKKLASTEHVNENAGVEVSYQNSSPRDIHFSLGQWNNISQAQKFRIGFKKVPEHTKTTPDAWIESGELDIVHGRVTGPDGKPIANSVIQIREKRKPGQKSIAAPDVITDKQGFYSYDSIKWPYSVGALFYEPDASGPDYRHQYKRLNKYLEGNQTVNFEFGNFPTGSAAIFGKAESPGGQDIKEFTVDVQLKVDYKDHSPRYLYQFGYRKPFTTEDGRFEISNLPTGVYNITIYPTKDQMIGSKELIKSKKYVYELQENQRLEIGAKSDREKLFYGRVLFEDGTPAVSDLEGFETQIIALGHDYTAGVTIAAVDKDGYFAAQVPDKGMEQFKSGKAWLTVCIAKPDIHHKIQKGERFPVELLSLEREKAGVLRIKRPDIYYGRILYENGKPAIPEVPPWPGAKVWSILRYTSATSKTGGITERLNDVDQDGYFSAYLTDEQIEQIKAGNYSIQIYHPSYELMRASYPIVNYPFEMLSTEKNNVKGYKLSSEVIIATELKDINNILESIEKLKGLFAVVETYAGDRQGNYPGTIGLLDSKAEEFQWLVENVEYLGDRVETTLSPAEIPLAYDKILLNKYGATLVLFRDGHIEYCWTRQLEILGVLETGIEKLP